MYEVIGNLKNKIILNEKIILDLKSYIYNKYPSKSSKELSLILADGIHRIINNNMGQFQEILINKIEGNLIRDAVRNSDFSISAYKVFCQYCKLDLENEGNISDLHEWLTFNQNRLVEKDELVDFINMVRSYANVPIEDAINNAADSVIGEMSTYYTNQAKDIKPQMNYFNHEYNIHTIEKETSKIIHKLIEFIAEFAHRIKNTFKAYSRKRALITVSLIIILFIIMNAKEIGYAFINNLSISKSKNTPEALVEDVLVKKTNKEVDNGLPKELKYIEIDKNLLRGWLDNKNSILAEDPYLSSIIEIAKQYDINPLFMIAITGQEQGFVPKSQENALKIANNPFNVYESWIGYNTTIDDSSKIAAQTIINLSKGRPEEVHAIQWINERYAEDKNWWVGVDKIFSQLQREIIK
jgi:hypothetical protein